MLLVEVETDKFKASLRMVLGDQIGLLFVFAFSKSNCTFLKSNAENFRKKIKKKQIKYENHSKQLLCSQKRPVNCGKH